MSSSSRSRDAWFVIRGYVYQVQITIDRWLNLRDDEVLELECGEDIDTVSAWTAGTDREDRLLEQIKHLDRSITLNSTEARAALANFVEHRANAAAPERIRFRFVTTARPAQERDPRIARDLVGIDAWMALRAESLGPREELVRFAALRRLLRQGARQTGAPAGVSAQVWRRYSDALEELDLERARVLVRGFEWSTGNVSVGDEENRLRGLLCETGFAVDEEDATRKHAALFVHVFRTLSRQGSKRLTSSDRTAVLASPTVAPQDRLAFARLSDAVAHLEAEVVDLRLHVEGHDRAIFRIGTQLEQFAAHFGLHASFSPTTTPSDFAPPPRPSHQAARTKAVAAINTAFTSHTWVALEGTNGSGKTELAIEMAESRGAHRRWIGMRDLDAARALFRLRHGFADLAPVQPVLERSQWYSCLAQQLPDGYLVILDDLPAVEADGDLGREICALVLGFRGTGRKLLTTSAKPLDPRLTSRLDGIVVRHVVPPLDTTEIALLLEAHGAPETWRRSQCVELIASVTSGHAELVVAATTYLRRHAWRSSTDELSALLRREHTLELQRSVLRRLLATVESDAARQLLFRCALVIGNFSIEEVSAIAAAAPPVASPRLLLAVLEGLWIQSITEGTFSVCPSAKPFGDEVAGPTRREINAMLARRIVNSGKIGPIDAHRAIAYSLVAEQFDNAILIACIAFEGLGRTDGADQADAGLLDLWASTPMPRGANLGLRIYARALQLGALARRGRNNEFVVTELLTLAKHATSEAPWALVTIITQAKLLSAYDYVATTALIFAAALGPNRFEIVDGPVVDLSSSTPLPNFLWHQASYARGATERRAWVEALRTVDRDRLRDVAKGVEYELACMGICDRVWIDEALKPEATHQWSRVHQELVEVDEAARTLGLPLLAALARRCRIGVSAGYESDLAKAAGIAAEASAWELADPTSHLLIFEALGRGLVAAGESKRGRDELQRALAASTSSFPIVRLHGMLWLSRAIGATEPTAAVSMAESALAFARTITILPDVELAKVLGEVATAHWKASGVSPAWKFLEAGVRVLYDKPRRDDRWRDAMILFSHATNVVSSFLWLGRAPDPVEKADGTKEPAGDLAPGLFLSHHDERHRFYKPEHEQLCTLAFLRFADRFAADDLLPYWVEHALASQAGVIEPAVTFVAGCCWIVELAARGDASGAIKRARSMTGDESVVAFATLAAVAGLASLRVENHAGADEEVTRVLDELEGGRKQSPTVGAWSLAGEIVRCSFREERADRLARLELLYGTPQVDRFLRTASRLGASIERGREFHRTFEDHINIGVSLDAPLGDPQRTVFRRLVGPLVTTYWRSAVQRSAFQFRAPNLLRTALDRVTTLPQPHQVRRVLHEVASSLQVSLPSPALAWLKKED